MSFIKNVRKKLNMKFLAVFKKFLQKKVTKLFRD